MGKLADYLISAVRYDSKHSHIEKVIVHEDQGDKVGPAFESSRQKVIENMKSKKTYITIFKGQGNNWNKGKEVHIIIVGRTEYIRTDRNQTECDNLENLPEI